MLIVKIALFVVGVTLLASAFEEIKQKSLKDKLIGIGFLCLGILMLVGTFM